MNARPVSRPLRAILQRRLQLAPLRPIRTPYCIRASQLRPQHRHNSSIVSEQPPKPNSSAEEQAKERSPDTQDSATPSPTESVQDVNSDSHLEPPERQQMAKGEIEIQQAEPGESARVVPGEPVADSEIAEIEPPNPAKADLPELIAYALKPELLNLRSENDDVKGGILKAIERHLEAAKAAQDVVEQGEAAAADAGQEDVSIRSTIREMNTSPAETQAETQQFDDLGKGREVHGDEQIETVVQDSADSAPPNAGPAIMNNEMLGQSDFRVQEVREAASVASQTEAPESRAAQDVTPELTSEELIIASYAEVIRPTKKKHELLTETAKDAEDVRDRVGLDSAKSSNTTSHSDALAPASKEEAEKIKRDRKDGNKHVEFGAAAEEELRERTEEKASELVESMKDDSVPDEPSRLPRNVQAFYLQPLRRQAKYNVPSCNLQLRSYSVRPLESFCDFALRAAYYLGLPAYGPTPLPKIIQRWTVPKSSFIFKKSQENFERITRRRLIQIRDGHPETVQIWLAFLQKHQQAGVGMKANVWEFSSLDVAKELGMAYEEAKPIIDDKFNLLGQDREMATVEKVDEMLTSQRYKLAGGR